MPSSSSDDVGRKELLESFSVRHASRGRSPRRSQRVVISSALCEHLLRLNYVGIISQEIVRHASSLQFHARSESQ